MRQYEVGDPFRVRLLAIGDDAERPTVGQSQEDLQNRGIEADSRDLQHAALRSSAVELARGAQEVDSGAVGNQNPIGSSGRTRSVDGICQPEIISDPIAISQEAIGPPSSAPRGERELRNSTCRQNPHETLLDKEQVERGVSRQAVKPLDRIRGVERNVDIARPQNSQNGDEEVDGTPSVDADPRLDPQPQAKQPDRERRRTPFELSE